MSDQPPVNVNVNQPEPGFTVTLKDVNDGLNAKLDALAGKIDGLVNLPEEVRDHEHRIRELEAHSVSKASARWWFTAIVGLVVAACAVVALILR